jgi:hypothetical protein
MTTPVNFSYEEMAPLIRVYKKLLPNHEEMKTSLDSMVDVNGGDYLYDKWTDWFIFGKYTQLKAGVFDSTIKFDSHMAKQLRLHRDLQESTRMAISHYVASHNVPLPKKSFITDVSLAYYHPGVDVTTDNSQLAMAPHTDYVNYEEGWPGEKFLITATTYVNDDYQGGEIYYIFDDKKLTYKPNAGEIIVFPSGNPLWPSDFPYFHGVNTPVNGRKYLLRCYLKYVTDASQEWIDGVNKYGEEEWKKMCKEKHQNKPTPGGQYFNIKP